nr:MAG TPA: hypothetical protein [Caudoviricetes sp.]
MSFLLEGLCGRVILHIFAFANRPMAGRIDARRLGRFIRQKCVLPTRLLLFERAQQTRSLCGFCGAGASGR